MGQELGQLVIGKVKEVNSKIPIAQANVSVYQKEELITGAVTDSVGYFQLIDVLPGRYKLVVTYTGYEGFEMELLVISGKKSSLEIRLRESSMVLDEVVIRPDNLSGANVTTISIEKAMRVPANFFDPVRMLTSYPGVVAANDQSNSIVVKGYSPNAILWRLQGLDIISPNHLANAGTLSDRPVANGGGVNVLSAQLLDQTDFYSGSLPAPYGNALSGVMDMKLRAGDSDKTRYTLQASVIGLDAAVEGPISKSRQSSFLANYRYSTVGLLSNAGVDFGGESISFQDFSFHLNAPSHKGGNLSVFGLGGLSANRFQAREEIEREEEKDRYDIDYTGKVFALGLVNQFKPSRTSVTIGASVSGQLQDRNAETDAANIYPMVLLDEYSSTRLLISGFIKAVYTLEKASLETGLMTNYFDQSLSSQRITSGNAFVNNVRGGMNGLLLQPYINWSKPIGKYWNATTALRYVYFTYAEASSLEPRLQIARTLNRGSIGLSYGITSQVQQLQTYLVNDNDMPLTKSHQIALEMKQTLARGLRFVSSVYYHQLFDAPAMTLSNSVYSTLNQLEEIPPSFLMPSGSGRNYGVEGLVEKRFYGDTYFMVSGSLYESKYRSEASYQDTRFNGNFTSSFLTGKEWKKTNRSFGVHARVLYLGGLREAVIDEVASAEAGTTIYIYQNGFSEQLPNYFRTDLRVSWRKNKPGYTRTLSIDIQNLTGQKNVGFHYYDTFLQKVKTKYQVGLIPVIAYRVDF